MCFICKKSGAGCVRSLLCILFIPFEKAGVWLTAYSFMSQQNCACVIFTWERLISYNRITSVWSEWAVCTVCPYKDPWLTVFFCFVCLFSPKIFACPSTIMTRFHPPPPDPLSEIVLQETTVRAVVFAADAPLICRLHFPNLTFSLTLFTVHLKVYQLFFSFFTQVAHVWCCMAVRIQNVKHH